MNPCTNCGAPNQAGAAFCAHCGGRIQAAPAMPAAFGAPAPGSHFLGTPMRICPGCGVIAPTQRTVCAVCNTQYGSTPPMVPPMPEGRYWGVILEADFACLACGQRSPLDGLTIAGHATCRRCGRQQPFDAEQWGEGLALTQNVADLAGPPGRRQPYEDNPFLAVGVTETWDEIRSEGTFTDGAGAMKPRTLRVRSAPGHPLCSKCRAPIEIMLDGQGRAQTTCPRCRDQAVYALPNDYDDQNVDLLAVISDEHRTDRPAMRTQGTNFKPIWCLFEDESPMRWGVADEDDDDDEHFHVHDKLATLREAQAAHARAQAAPPQRKEAGAGTMVGLVGIGVGVLVVVGVLALIVMNTRSSKPSAPDPKDEEASEKKSEKKGKKAKPASDEEPEPEPAKKAKALVAFDKSKYKRLDGCVCKASPDGKGPVVTMQLMVRLESEDKLKGSDTTRFGAAWTIDVPGQSSYPLVLEGEGAQSPPREVLGRGISVGVACAKDAFIVVSGDRADAWSATSEKHLWGAKLAANYAIVAAPSEGGLNIKCDTVPVVGKSLKVPLVGGKVQTFDLTTGK